MKVLYKTLNPMYNDYVKMREGRKPHRKNANAKNTTQKRKNFLTDTRERVYNIGEDERGITDRRTRARAPDQSSNPKQKTKRKQKSRKKR